MRTAIALLIPPNKLGALGSASIACMPKVAPASCGLAGTGSDSVVVPFGSSASTLSSAGTHSRQPGPPNAPRSTGSGLPFHLSRPPPNASSASDGCGGVVVGVTANALPSVGPALVAPANASDGLLPTAQPGPYAAQVATGAGSYSQTPGPISTSRPRRVSVTTAS